jgi:hypothetical protein
MFAPKAERLTQAENKTAVPFTMPFLIILSPLTLNWNGGTWE